MVGPSSDPGIAVGELQLAAAGTGHLVVNRLAVEKSGKTEGGVPVMREEKACDVQSRQVHAVMDPVLVLGAESHLVPAVELEGEKDIEFQVQVGTLAIQAGPAVSHSSENLPGFDLLPCLHACTGKVSVKAKKRSLAPIMLDYHVASVIAAPCTGLNVDDPTESDCAHVVEWSPTRVAFYGADIYPLMEPGRNDTLLSSTEISDESIAAALPWSAALTFEGSVDEHVEALRPVVEKSAVVGG